jgi:hypothetical protein
MQHAGDSYGMNTEFQKKNGKEDFMSQKNEKLPA